MLGALADVAVLFSIQTMRALVAEVMQSGSASSGPGNHKFPRRRCVSESSGDETAMSGYSTTDYTSGALSSDDSTAIRTQGLVPKSSGAIASTITAINLKQEWSF